VNKALHTTMVTVAQPNNFIKNKAFLALLRMSFFLTLLGNSKINTAYNKDMVFK
jgi:hypothetical protein